MGKFLAYLSTSGAVLEMENFKECKKSYTYESFYRLSNDKCSFISTKSYQKEKLSFR